MYPFWAAYWHCLNESAIIACVKPFFVLGIIKKFRITQSAHWHTLTSARRTVEFVWTIKSLLCCTRALNACHVTANYGIVTAPRTRWLNSSSSFFFFENSRFCFTLLPNLFFLQILVHEINEQSHSTCITSMKNAGKWGEWSGTQRWNKKED